ncbi:MAG TPA: hypothetical protein VI455_12090 [Terriglobia bacterium]
MLLRLNHSPTIDNLRNYPREIVEQLRSVLTNGARANADPRRKAFYDVTDGERVFFIHISPVSGNVWLLASWLAEPADQLAAPLSARAATAANFAVCAHFC